VDYSKLRFEFENTVSLKSLRSPHAPLIFSFLYEQFKQQQRITTPYRDLVDSLEAVLEELKAQDPTSFPQGAKVYLDNWSKELRLLRIYLGSNNEWFAELTPEAERVIRWLEELRQRPFVGTESRFRSIFSTLSEIVANSTTDPKQRLDHLYKQQGILQHEIDEILSTGQVRRLNETQIRERYLQTNENALRLLSDFAAVEQSFRDLARRTQEAALRPELQKGNVIGEVLDADDALENSDEGRSFRAFWQFLLSPSQKDEFTRLLSITQQLPELAELRQNSILAGLTRRLLDAGHKIVESNQQLAEQLRRILDERVIAESQRVRQLCMEIKQLAFQMVREQPSDEDFLHLETEPAVNLLLDRPLWSPGEESRFQPPDGEYRGVDASALESLYKQYYVDESLLESHISELLEAYERINLSDVLAYYPATKSIGEVLTYLRLAANSPHHSIDSTQSELIEVQLYESQTHVKLLVPLTTYRRLTIQ